MAKEKFTFNPTTQAMLGAISDISCTAWQMYSSSIMYGFTKVQAFTLAKVFVVETIRNSGRSQS